MIEVRDLLAEDGNPRGARRPADRRLQRVLIVGDGESLVRGQPGCRAAAIWCSSPPGPISVGNGLDDGSFCLAMVPLTVGRGTPTSEMLRLPAAGTQTTGLDRGLSARSPLSLPSYEVLPSHILRTPICAGPRLRAAETNPLRRPAERGELPCQSDPAWTANHDRPRMRSAAVSRLLPVATGTPTRLISGGSEVKLPVTAPVGTISTRSPPRDPAPRPSPPRQPVGLSWRRSRPQLGDRPASGIDPRSPSSRSRTVTVPSAASFSPTTNM